MSKTGAAQPVTGVFWDPRLGRLVFERNITEQPLLVDPTSPSGTGISATIVDATGDLIVATAADVVARLGVGANNTVLTADSAQTSGVKWSTTVISAITDKGGEVFNVKAYGVVGDGSTSDTAALNTLFGTTMPSTGAEAFFPAVATYYKIDGAMLACKSNHTYSGSGYGSQVKDVTTPTGLSIFQLNDVTKVTIRNLRITGSGSTFSGGRGGIWFAIGSVYGGRDCKVSNVWVESVATSGISVGDSDRIQLENITIDSVVEHGLYIGTSNTYVEAVNAVIRSSADRNIKFCNSFGPITTDCIVTNLLSLTAGTDGVLFTEFAQRCSVKGGTIVNSTERNVRWVAGSPTNNGNGVEGLSLIGGGNENIRIMGGSGGYVRNCRFDRGATQNVQVQIDAAAASYQIANCEFLNNPTTGAYAIDVLGDLNDISENYLVGGAGTNGIRFQAGGDNNRESYNRNNAATALTNAGAGNVSRAW